MPASTFEIRVCYSCGLRYPLPLSERHPPGRRCPACQGETRLILSRKLVNESTHDLSASSSQNGGMSLLLDNVRSGWNVGSIIRSANGFGYTHVGLCGITPTPENESVRKTSLGAEKSLTWSYHKNALAFTAELKSKDWKIIALEEHERSIPLTQAPKPEGANPTLLIVGNEITGVDPQLLDLCDEIYHIPMLGEKKSFNVAIAFGIAAYALKELY